MRLIIVSNRLPITIFTKNNKFELRQSVGGLTTGLSAFLNYMRKTNKYLDSVWVGWAGSFIGQSTEVQETFESLSYHPVDISDSLMGPFYSGFCNNTIWPLFHGMTSYANYSENEWHAYEEVNQIYFDAISQTLQQDDVIWIHDYHFLLLPKLLRQKFPHTRIGFFLHIPFPHFEAIQFLPKNCRHSMIDGLLGADLIGFHTYEYCQYFIKSVIKVQGIIQKLGKLHVGNRQITVESYPMGIDVNYIQSKLDTNESEEQIQNFRYLFNGCKLILSVDRLDYTKGLQNRLKGYMQFLEKHPEWHDKVKLLLIVSPSREEVSQYKSIKQEVDHLVGLINGKYSQLGWTPVIYQYRSYSYEQLIALYSLADVALVTPIRDGMNLVAKEFIAAKKNRTGVLILSETAGAAKELLDAIIVNAHSIDEIANAIKEGLEMDETEQLNRIETMQKILKKNDIRRWGENFLHDLIDIENHHPKPISMNVTDTKAMMKRYQEAKRCLFMLDYDGTLVPFANHPQLAQPNFNTLKLLKDLSNQKKIDIAIISGRDKNTLEQWLGHLGITLVAEHCGWIKTNGQWEQRVSHTPYWKTSITKILQEFMLRLPESHIEIKDFSVVFHYRNCDRRKSQTVIKQLLDYLLMITAQENLIVMPGNAIIEIKIANLGKNNAALQLLNIANYDFILAIGDDTTDEDLFSVLPQDAISIKVGMDPSLAQFNLANQKNVLELLNLFNETKAHEYNFEV